MARLMRTLAAVALAIGVANVPVQQAAACDCMFVELPDAIRAADVAFVGQAVERTPGGDNFGFPVTDHWTWSVERGRDPGMDATVRVDAYADDGANCGVSFGLGERWLVIASVHEGVIQTNGCQPNQRMDGMPPETEALVAELVGENAGSVAAAPPSIPGPLLLAFAAVAVVGGIGLLAFRRESRT
jgi:hypothetical protein